MSTVALIARILMIAIIVLYFLRLFA